MLKNLIASRAGIYLVAYPLLMLTGYFDYLTGNEISTSVVYFFPIFLIASNRSTQLFDSLLIALFCSICWLVFELVGGYAYSNPAYRYWNGFVRAATFFIIAYIVYRLRRSRQKLEAANQELARVNAEKDRFIGIAAHDIRNPLANVYNISILLGAGAPLEPKQQELVVLLKRISTETLTMLTNLLDISQIESGVLRLSKTTQDYAAFVKEQIMFNSHLANKKNQQIIFQSEALALPLAFDSSYTSQILSNLLTNAVKFSLPHTSIEVLVEAFPDHVKTSVKDQGIGIAPEDMKKIFSPFSKGSGRPTAGESSTGLGLAIVKKLVEAHGGQLGVESVKGKGATFFFTLAREQGSAHQ